MKPLASRRSAIVSVLDIGSSKIACMVARVKPADSETLRRRTHAIEVLGFASTRSRGIKSGVVVDLDEAERAIRLAVDAAERMAEVTVGSLIVNVSAGRLKSETFSAAIAVKGPVTEADIQSALAAGGAHSISQGRMVLHALPIGYSLDGNRGMHDPIGMLGEQLGVDMHVVTADEPPLSNIELAVNRCHLEVATVVATPYAAGLAALVDDEAELGVACVDMGGGTTTLGIFHGGELIHTDAVAVGGQHVTVDLARGLGTNIADAERLKARHGSALASGTDEREILTIPPVGDAGGHPNTVARSALTSIIRPRVEETLEMVRDMLRRSGFAEEIGSRIVLTGGASQLTGLAEVARRMLGKDVRVGRPLGIHGLPDAARSPAYSATVGLIIYPQVATIEQFWANDRGGARMTGTDGYFARMGRWIKDSF